MKTCTNKRLLILLVMMYGMFIITGCSKSTTTKEPQNAENSTNVTDDSNKDASTSEPQNEDNDTSSSEPQNADTDANVGESESVDVDETSNESENENIDDAEEVVEPSETADQIVAWHGIEFSIPSYYDVFDSEGSNDVTMVYYPSDDNAYAAMIFQMEEFDGTAKEFKSLIPTLIENTLSFYPNPELQTSEERTIATLPGWLITYTVDVPETEVGPITSTMAYAYLFNEKSGKAIYVNCAYDSVDQSQNDYMGDFFKVLDNAKYAN